MAITAIEITQDNIEGVVNLISVHNPLVFIAKATWTTTAPDVIYVDVIRDLVASRYTGIYLSDTSATERNFLFVADEAIRNRMDDLEDIIQTTGTIINIGNLTQDIKIDFDDGAAVSDNVDIIACHAARDFENPYGAALYEEWNNETKYFVGAVGQQMYLYWWNDDATNIINGDIGITIGVDEDVTVKNINDSIVANPTYSPYIDNLALATDIHCYYFTSPPDSRIVFEAQNGAAITFSATNFGASFSPVISNNGTATAKMIVTLLANPADGEAFEFNFDTDLTPIAPGGILLDEFMGVAGGTLYDKGFIRKAIAPSTSGEQTESITINSTTLSHTVNVRDWCTGDQLLKFVDRNGWYRFMSFNKYYQRGSTPESIGDLNLFITSLKTDSGNTKKIGYKNNDRLILQAVGLNSSEQALLKDLYNSHEVLLLVGSKWVRVEVAGDNISKLQKRKFQDLTIEVILPQSYNISLL